MTPVWEIDSNGNIVEHYLWTQEQIDEARANGKIIIDFPWGVGFYSPKFDIANNKWVEGITQEELVAMAKSTKLDELDAICSQTILDNFTYQYSDGVTYYFNNDTLAQGNFDKVLNAFDKGLLTSINWTAYKEDGTVVRLKFDSTSYLTLYEAHLGHIQGSISRFRDQLQPYVEQQTTTEAVLAITWDTDTTVTSTASSSSSSTATPTTTISGVA